MKDMYERLNPWYLMDIEEPQAGDHIEIKARVTDEDGITESVFWPIKYEKPIEFKNKSRKHTEVYWRLV